MTVGLQFHDAAVAGDQGDGAQADDGLRRLDAGCMVCGDAGSVGPSLGLCFVPSDSGGIRASFKILGRYQGYDNVLHTAA